MKIQMCRPTLISVAKQSILSLDDGVSCQNACVDKIVKKCRPCIILSIRNRGLLLKDNLSKSDISPVSWD